MEHTAFEPLIDEQRDAGELARLADELIEHIETARQEYAELHAAIDAAVAAATEPEAPVELDGGSNGGTADEAQLVALNLALAGANRHDAHLQIVETFGIVDTDDLLDRAFGSEFDGAQRPVARRRFGRLARPRR